LLKNIIKNRSHHKNKNALKAIGLKERFLFAKQATKL